MLPFEDRYTRQRQVPEVGLAGQERLLQHRCAVPQGASGDVAALYLSRAGVNVERCAEPTPEPAVHSSLASPNTFVQAAHFNHAAFFNHEGPRSFASGAHWALSVLRQVLRLPPENSQEQS